LFLSALDRLAASKKDFAFETTLSGLAYASRLEHWRRSGYRIEIIYLRVADVRLCLARIADRVRAGGHDIPEPDVHRRFARSWNNFQKCYRLRADDIRIFDVSGPSPILIPKRRMKTPPIDPKRSRIERRSANIPK